MDQKMWFEESVRSVGGRENRRGPGGGTAVRVEAAPTEAPKPKGT